MVFEDLIKGINSIRKKGDFSQEISGIQYDSRKNCRGKVFICLTGDSFDGHDFAMQAHKKGASGFLVEKWIKIDSKPIIQVKDSRSAMAKVAINLFEDPSKELDLVGVTGTNGKTTVSYLIDSIYRKADSKSGLIGTVKCISGENEICINRTTPESADLQKIFSQMSYEGVKNCVMEVSSHSVIMKRIQGTHFKALVFTNLSQDHLDFHGNMDEYFKAKKRLFNKKGQIDVINIDDEHGKELLKISDNNVTYGIESDVDYRAKNIKMTNEGITFTLKTPNGKKLIQSSLGGKFNVYNCLAAAAVTREMGFELDQIKRGIKALSSVDGRMQFVQRRPFNVIVDYAHTPDGLNNLLETINDFTKGKTITVFGCGGDRDKGKRSKMGKVASVLSDFVIVTSDNPRSEEPSIIINEIVKDIDNQPYWIEENRKDAIARAIEIAKPNDSVVIAGKGHEDYQEIKEKKYPFNDVKVVKKYL